jgi:hypothetical protein
VHIDGGMVHPGHGLLLNMSQQKKLHIGQARKKKMPKK